jgi:hypothetical protein
MSKESTRAAQYWGLQRLERSMKLLTDLFSTDYGLMSISGIIFMLGMGVFFWRFFQRKMNEDAANQRN